jgi:hypothetical protein
MILWWLSVVLPVVTAQYTMVTSRPDCYFKLGSQYCPVATPFTQEYASWMDRTHHVLVNMARTSPNGFSARYNVSFSCSAVATSALPYNAGLHQASKQQSWLLNQPNCSFSHSTCTRFCNLYRNDCNFIARVNYYQPNWTSIAENIVKTTSTTNPLAPLLSWIRSPGHCRNIMASGHTHLGVGQVQLYWTQTFGTLPTRINNPLVSGTHYAGAPLTSGTVWGFVTYSASTAPSRIAMRINGTRDYTMNLFMGTATRGTYAVDLRIPYSCSTSYIFETQTNGIIYRFPEAGQFILCSRRNV